MSTPQDIPEAQDACRRIADQCLTDPDGAMFHVISTACREYAKRRDAEEFERHIGCPTLPTELELQLSEKNAALANADANIAALHHELATLREDVKPLLDSMMMNDAKSAFLSKHPDLQ